MSQNAILFIPDISGFTEFVHHTDINHSRHIISELLELLIDSNSIGLELAEIEGDALFFYRLADEINHRNLEEQIHKMYTAFHTHLKRYEYERICHCGACSSAYNLNLKFVVHYGEIEFITVKDSKKPYGSNVIQVHRLLKNDVPINEYVIFTENVKSLANEDSSIIIEANYDFGSIKFIYNALDYLREKLPEIKPIPDDIPKHRIYSKTQIIKAPILDLYEVISNFDYRLLWVKGIDELEYEKNKVNRTGTKHQCLINKNRKVNQVTVTKTAEKGEMVYGESTTELPFTKRLNAYYILKEENDRYTKLTLEVYIDFKPFGIFMKPLMKKNFKKIISENIKELILLIDSDFKPKSQII